MKISLSLVLLFFAAYLQAQTHQIIKHNDEKVNVNFIKIENNLIYYTFPESSEEKKISKYAVAQLNDKSNKSHFIASQKIDITKRGDYKKVIILRETETIGLKKLETIRVFTPKIKGESNLSTQERGERRLKEKAAFKGNPFFVIVSSKNEYLTAISYTY
ncbi:hypothetical protein ACFX5F_03675 [Flavobacterium sp. ZS1P70]|uniref:Uncharacterized protein n=1 Tax=Flavobacterium zhoui TaxID=3230414 RepID=A0ABW6I2U8_9FLAO